MEEAYAQAAAELGLADDTDQVAGSPEEGQTQARPEAAETTDAPASSEDGEARSAEPERRPSSDPTQSELNRIETMVREGRIGELTARQRGIYEAIRERTLEDQRIETAVVNRALELRQMRQDDPEGFLEWREQNPSQAQAYDQFWSLPQNANLTAENRRPAPSPEQIRAAERGRWEQAVQETAEAIATDGGLTQEEYRQLVAEHGTNYGSLLQASFNTAVNKAVAAKLTSERAKLESEITEAVRKELTVEFANSRMVRFPGGGTTGNPTPSKTPAGSLEEALNAAYAEHEGQFANAR